MALHILALGPAQHNGFSSCWIDIRHSHISIKLLYLPSPPLRIFFQLCLSWPNTLLLSIERCNWPGSMIVV